MLKLFLGNAFAGVVQVAIFGWKYSRTWKMIATIFPKR